MNTKKLNSLTKRLDYKKLSKKKKRKYIEKLNIIEKKEIKYMNFEFIDEENTEIEIGDVLLCADGYALQPLLIISDNGQVSAINLNTYRNEHTGDHLKELYNFISNAWNINEIIKGENVLLQFKRS